MKKIKFGSFPLISIPEEEQNCIDNYSIKAYADLITMSTQMRRNDSDTQSYITPDVILKYFKSDYIESQTAKGNPDFEKKKKTMKRAFNSLQNFTKVIKGNAFYRDVVSYPIYIESLNRKGSHDYDFILLSNDLVRKETLKEIDYSDALSMTFLILKDQLYPELSLNGIGSQGESHQIRSDMAKFIEFSKMNQTDPITALIKLIKIAGRKKQKEGSSFGGFKSSISQNSALKKVTANNFFKLFGGDRKTGQIKDVNFLLNEVKHLQISEFFNDNSYINRNSHLPGNKRDVVPVETDIQNIDSRMERQYLSQKTQEYNKILSMVDSLISFNSNNKIQDILQDMDSAVKDASVKIGEGDEAIDVELNFDKIVDSIRNDYFEGFMKNTVSKLNALQTSIQSTFEHSKNLDSLVDDNSIGAQIRVVNDRLKENREALHTLMNGEESEYSAEKIGWLNEVVKNDQMQLKHLSSIQLFNPEVNDPKKIGVTSTLIYNIEAVQNELVGILHDIEASIYDEVCIKKLFEVLNTTAPQKSDILEFLHNNKLYYNIDKLIESIIDSLRDQLISENAQVVFESQLFDKLDIIEEEYNIAAGPYKKDAPNPYADNTSRHTEYDYTTRSNEHQRVKNTFTKTVNQKEDVISPDVVEEYFRSNADKIRLKIQDIVENQIFILYKRLGREYANVNSFKSKAYADLRTENSPVIRKTVGKPNNFRTFILNTDVLLNLYQMLSHIDNQKYIAGLLAYPPSKISDPENQMQLMLERLGIGENPVFIIDSKRGMIHFSQPDFLSLTGTNIFSKIRFDELEKMCSVDYFKQLWNNSQMFKRDIAQEVKDREDRFRTDMDKAEGKNEEALFRMIADYKSMDKDDIKRNQLGKNITNKQGEIKKIQKIYNDDFTRLQKHKAQTAGQEYGTSTYTQPTEFDGENIQKSIYDIDGVDYNIGGQSNSNGQQNGQSCGPGNKGKIKNGKCVRKNKSGKEADWNRGTKNNGTWHN